VAVSKTLLLSKVLLLCFFNYFSFCLLCLRPLSPAHAYLYCPSLHLYQHRYKQLQPPRVLVCNPTSAMVVTGCQHLGWWLPDQ
jgi:hypothetical protein